MRTGPTELRSSLTTTLAEALASWSGICAERANFAAGYTAVLGPFLAGWFSRDMGVAEPTTLGTFTSSWRAGWKACDSLKMIQAREVPHAFVLNNPEEHTVGGWCQTCGLAPYARLRTGGPLHQEPG